MTRYVVLAMVLLLGIQEGLAREQVSVKVPDKAEPCIEWGKTVRGIARGGGVRFGPRWQAGYRDFR